MSGGKKKRTTKSNLLVWGRIICPGPGKGQSSGDIAGKLVE